MALEDSTVDRLAEQPTAIALPDASGNSVSNEEDLLPGVEYDFFPWSVVDFRSLFMLPKDFLGSFTGHAGPRLRLRSHYREHLAQAFARYFMRVGLPHDARSFEKEGDRP